jgi:hypothetical protein
MKRPNSWPLISPRINIPDPNHTTTEMLPNRTKMMNATKKALALAPRRVTRRNSSSLDEYRSSSNSSFP